MLKLKLKMKQKFKKQFPVSSLMLMLVLVLSSFTSISLQAQDRVTGKVTGQDGTPLPGVNILQKGTSKGTVTDFDGKFSLLLASGNKTLLFSYIGYKNKEIPVGADNVVNVVLEEDIESLEEIIVVGFRPVDREKLLGGVTAVKAEDIEKTTPIEAFEGVQGRVSGVQIISNNTPGSGFEVNIRGVSSFGDQQPLFVVDGQQVDDINNIDPSDIESFDILKDGASTAIYGARGGNGVVLITTKSGKAGDNKISVTTVTGVNTRISQIPLLNGRQAIELRREITNENSRENRDLFNNLLTDSNDFFDLITRPSFRHNTNVTVSGGTEKATYYWNTGFVTQDGIIISSKYRRINTQLRNNVKAFGWLTLNNSLNASFEDVDEVNEFRSTQSIISRPPFFPVLEPDGSFVPTLFGRRNPLAGALAAENRRREFRFRDNVSATLNFTKHISFKSSLGVDFRIRKQEAFTPTIIKNPNARPLVADGNLIHDLRERIQQDNVLSYNNKIGKHSIDAFVGNQIVLQSRENEAVRSTAFANEIIRTFNNSNQDALGTTDTFHTENNIVSLFSGFNYDYAGKYLIGGTVRRDGSSRFGEDRRFGYFPSASLGWKASREGFLKDNKVVKNLLFRYAWGIAGNDRIGDFDFTDALVPVQFNGLVGFAQSRIGNADISWEETESHNLGFDLALFQGQRFNLSFDIWERTTDDLLQNLNIPNEQGLLSVRQNIGSVRNRGIDVSLSGTIIKGKGFSWKSGFNIGFLENEVLSIAGDESSFFQGFTIVEEGQPIANFFGFNNQGVYAFDESNAYTETGQRLDLVTTVNPTTGRQEIDFDENGAPQYTLNGESFEGETFQLRSQGNVLQGGDVIFENSTDNVVDEEGNVIGGDLVIDDQDRKVIGNGLATTYGGFSNDFKYKGFSLSLLFDFSLNFDIYRRFDEDRDRLNNAFIFPSPDRFFNAWRQPGDIAEFPRLGQNIAQNVASRPSSQYIDNGSFIRWRSARVDYRLPKSVIDRVKGLKGAKLNFGVNNILTWTNYEGPNPEIGSRGNSLERNVDLARTPNNRQFTLGLKVDF
jgi:TonB-linked SusC/RagA family outer membrane protein